MADEPVSAWREPLTERARRWMRRHRTAATAGAIAVVMALVGLSGVLLVQKLRQQRPACGQSRASEPGSSWQWRRSRHFIPA